MNKKSTRVLLVLVAFALLIVPIVAFAADGFDDVDSGNVFVADIQWMKDSGITKGCNPPANTNFCPGDGVTRQQMAAFMRRLAVNKVVDAATAVNADNANTLDGEHASSFLDKSVYDTNDDGVVDSAEVKIRYTDQSFSVDLGVSLADRVQCVTGAMTFDGSTTVVASGSLSLKPIGVSSSTVNASVYYSTDGGTSWTFFNGTGIAATPDGGTGSAAVPINAVQTLPAGTYTFAIRPGGGDYQAGIDYSGYCESTITAYVGMGASIDVGVNTADLSDTGK